MRTVNLQEWQIEALKDRNPVVVFAGGAGSGKSYLALLKLYIFCIKNPGAFCIIVRKTRTSLINSTINDLETKIIGKDNPFVEHVRSRSRFEFTNGSLIAYYGLADAADRERIRSISVDMAVLEEATELSFDDLQEVKGRMRGIASDFRQIMIVCNPGDYLHWINQELILTGNCKYYNPRPEDNASNLPEEYIESLKALKGNKRASLYQGIWTTKGGMVYPFDYFKTVIDPIPKEKRLHWKYFISIDFGYRSPTVMQLWGVDGEENFYLVKELYKSGLSPQNIADELYVFEEDYNVFDIVVDHDSAIRSFLEEKNYSLTLAIKDISQGTQLAIDAFENDRIKIFRDFSTYRDENLAKQNKPTNFIEEIGRYTWVLVRKDREYIEVPRREDDHSMDCMRYFISFYEKKRGFSVVYLGNINLSF